MFKMFRKIFNNSEKKIKKSYSETFITSDNKTELNNIKHSNTFSGSIEGYRKNYKFKCINCNKIIYNKYIIFCDKDCETSYKLCNS